jgi:5'-deoxynucleotidase YfbR-like HD superfamily hydrolase
MLKQWQATFTRRWHTLPHLSHTVDPVGYHSGRMAVLALTLFPDASRYLLAAIAVHDLGESVTGDVPWSAKRTRELKYLLDGIEQMQMRGFGFGDMMKLNGLDARRLKFLDRLDAYLWANHHAPEMVDRDFDWQEQLDWLNKEAEELGCQLNM